jgi:hypothetical protein
MPGSRGNALSFHSYAANVAGEQSVVAPGGREPRSAIGRPCWRRSSAPPDPVILGRITDEMDAGLVPWLDWAYNESIVADATRPAGPDNLLSARRARDAPSAPIRPRSPEFPPPSPSTAPRRSSRVRVHATAAGPRDRRGRMTVIEIPRRTIRTGTWCGSGAPGWTRPAARRGSCCATAACGERVGAGDAARPGRCAPVPRRRQCRTVTVTSRFSCTHVMASVLPIDG